MKTSLELSHILAFPHDLILEDIKNIVTMEVESLCGVVYLGHVSLNQLLAHYGDAARALVMQ